MTALLAALALLIPADGVNVPPAMLRIEQSATVYAPAVRIDPPGPVCAPDDIPCVIRDVWPDALEEKALRVAWRESNWTPRVRNSCCWGLYQIYWTVHRSWLCNDLAICDPYQLYDARTNATAALALYQRAGGWGPWQT